MKTAVISEQRKREAIIRIQGGKRLQPVGNSLAALIPKAWADLYAWEIDGRYWAKIESVDNRLIISPINKEEALKLMKVNNVSPR